MKTTISDHDARRVIEEGTQKVTTDDIQRVVNRADDIQRKVSGHGPLARFMNDVKLMIALVKDYWNKNYSEAPWWTIAAAATALLYVLNPVDIVPDFIPLVGFLDDATVVSACLFLLEKDLMKYSNWKNSSPVSGEDEG